MINELFFILDYHSFSCVYIIWSSELTIFDLITFTKYLWTGKTIPQSPSFYAIVL